MEKCRVIYENKDENEIEPHRDGEEQIWRDETDSPNINLNRVRIAERENLEKMYASGVPSTEL